MKILLVEDEEPIAKALTAVLTAQHYVVDVATDGEAGWDLVKAFAYDLILLDVMLPKLDGISLCQRLRSHSYQMPILLLTAQNSSTDKVMGLDAGADDYVIKPFDLQELLARIRVLLRRGSSFLPAVLEWESLRLNPSSCEVTYSGQLLYLTPKEYRLLELFLRNKSRVFSRSAIIEHLWSFEEPPNEETVTSHIKGLRHKLKTAGAPGNFIETVYGLGYRLKERGSSARSGRKTQVQKQTLEAMAGVWEQFKEKLRDRVAVLELDARGMLMNPPGDEVRKKMQLEAHKLAGGLGIFGFPYGSRLASEVEQILQYDPILAPTQIQRICELVAALRLELKKPPSEQPPAPVPHHNDSLVLMIDDDAELAQAIKIEAAAWGVRLEVATDLSVARDKISRKPPDAVLLDLSFSDASESGLTMLSELTKRIPPIPVLVFTARDSFSDRVEVARLGGRAFLHKPVPPAKVLEVLSQMLKQNRSGEATVMVVDDEEPMLADVRTFLEPWGLRVITLEDPRRFWDILAESAPDLLVLDVEMPYFSGIELCQVVRNDLRWGDLPVLFLTAHTDADTVHRLFIAGADDYASKPIIGPELVTRVISRLERKRYAHETR